MELMSLLLLMCLLIINQLKAGATEAIYDVTCSSKMMEVTIYVNSSDTTVYLDRLKGYPGCHPDTSSDHATFKLPLDNIYGCGTTKMLNKLTGQKLYYHRVILEHSNKDREMVLVRCILPGDRKKTLIKSLRNKRRTLPEEVSEPDFVNITDYIEAHANVPYLSLTLRQNGRFLDTTFNVQPGSPLEMLIFQDKKNEERYGLLTSYLKVTDNPPQQEEIIIMNGCSIDPYIFGNFETIDNGNTLLAKFRAFKFPDSNYVLFVGTVEVCLQQCNGVPCGNTLYGFGRKKREIPAELPEDLSRVFEVEMTAFLRVERDPELFPSGQGSLNGDYDDSDQLTQTADSSGSLFPTTVTLLLCISAHLII